MELIDKIKIKRSDNIFYKIVIVIIYRFLLTFGLIIMLFTGIISIFQKKEIEEKQTENTMEKWTFLAEYKNVKILKKYLHEIRFGPAYFELKSEPKNLNFNNKIFGDWFYESENLIFLQQWNSTEKPNTNLVLFNAETNEMKIIEKNLDSVLWEMKNENEENLNLICNTGYEIKTYRIQKNYTQHRICKMAG